MKKLYNFYFLIICFGFTNLYSQLFTPPNFVQPLNFPLTINNINLSSLGNTLHYGAPIILQNYTLTNSANFGYISSQEVQISATSEISPNNQGSFVARIADAPFDVVLTNKQNMSFNTPDPVPLNINKYKVVEFGLKLKPTVQTLIDNFLNDSNPPSAGGLNPYDKDVINVEADFYQGQLPNGFKKRYGFYMKDHQQINPYTSNSVLAPVNTLYPFRIRFCPPFVGTMYVKIRVYINGVQLTDDSNNPYEYISPTFNVLQTTEKGPLEIGNYNHLRYKDNGEQFFATGQNLTREGDFTGYYEEFIGSFSDMNDQGNFTRIRMDPGALGIEWEELGVYGSQRPNRLANYNPPNITPWYRQTQAFILDKSIEAAADNGVYFILCLEEDQNLNNNLYGNPTNDPNNYFHWNQNPYKTISGVSTVFDFLLLNSPRDYWKKRLHYVLARWGYSPYLAVQEVFNETDHIAENLTGQQSYAGNPFFAATTHSFIKDIRQFIKGYDNKYLVTTGFGNCPKLMDALSSSFVGNSKLDNLDCYSCNNYQTSKYSNWVRFDNTRDFINQYNRPFIFGENGIGDCNPSVDEFTDIEYHNTAWSTSMMGGMGSGLYWYDQNSYYKKRNLRAVKNFMRNIPFESNNFKGHYDDDKLLNAYNSAHFTLLGGPNYQWFYSVNQSGSKAFGWLHNYDTWFAVDPNYNSNNFGGCAFSAPSHDNSGVPAALPTFKIIDMQLFHSYQVDFYKTYSSSAPYQQSTINYAGILGLHVTYPGLLGVLPNGTIESSQADNNSNIQPDVAFRIRKIGEQFAYRTNNESLYELNFMDGEDDVDSLVQHQNLEIQNDTIFKSDEPVKIAGIIDINHSNYTYFWDFGNGQTSTSEHPSVLYNVPGNYNAVLTYTDSQNQIYTVKQTIVVIENKSQLESGYTYGISIFPNPTQAEVFLQNKYGIEINSVEIYNSLLQLIDRTDKKDGVIFDLKDYLNGIYFIKITLSDNKTILSFKLIRS